MSRTAASAAASGQAKSSSEDEPELINRIRFLELKDDKSSIYWPALMFENFGVMKTFLESRGLFDQAMFASTTSEFTFRILNLMNGSAVADRVALLLGSKNPTGKRCVFAPTGDLAIHEAIEETVNEAHQNSDLKEAIDVLKSIMESDQMPGDTQGKATVASDAEIEEAVGQTRSVQASDQSAVSREKESPETANGKSGESSYPKDSRTVTTEEPESPATTESVSVEASDQSLTSTEVESPERPKRARRKSSQQPSASSKTVECSDKSVSTTETDSVEASDKSVSSSSEAESSQQSSRTSSRLQKTKEDKPKGKGGGAKKATASRPAAKKKTKATSRKKATAVRKKPVPSKHKMTKPSTQKTKRSKPAPSESVDNGPPRSSPRNQGRANNEGGRGKETKAIDNTPPSGSKSKAGSSSVESHASLMPATIPTLEDVRPILRKVGFTIRNGSFVLPGVDPSKDEYVLDRDYFENGSRMRRYLCAYGIDTKGYELEDEKNKTTVKEEKELLSLWIRTAIVPGLRGMKGEVPEELRYFLPSGEVHNLLMDLSFTYGTEGYYFLPGEKPKRAGGLLLNGRKMVGKGGLLVYLARFGLPRTCKFENVSDEDRLRLEYHISQAARLEYHISRPSKVDALMKIEPTESDPPIFCDDDSKVPTAEKSHEGSKASRSRNINTVEESNANTVLQTQNGSPASLRTFITNSTNAEKETRAVAEEESKDEEFRPADDESTAISEQGDAEHQLTEKDGRQEPVPFTQPDCDASTRSDETTLSSDGDSPQNCDTKDTKSTTEFVGQLCGNAAGDDVTSPLARTQLFSETPDRASPASDAEEKDASQADETDDASSSVDAEGNDGAKTSPTDPAFQEQINDMLASNEQSPTGSDCVMEMIDDSPQSTSSKETAKMSGSQQASSSVDVAADEDKNCSSKRSPGATSDAESMDSSNSKVRSAKVRMPDDKEPSVTPIKIAITIGKNDEWPLVYKKMEALGWTWKNGLGLVGHIYLPPGGKPPTAGGVLDEHYVEEIFGMKKYAHKHLGWNGDEAFLKELEASQSTDSPGGRFTRRSTRQTSPSRGNETKGASTSLSPEGARQSQTKKRRASQRSQPAAKKPNLGVASSTKDGQRLKAGHPELKRSVGGKLKACHEALGSSFNAETLSTARGTNESIFQKNVDGLTTFLREAVASKGAHGREADEPACLYVCGAPGIGKTSSVKWALEDTERWASDQQGLLPPSVCFVSAADVLSPKQISDKIADALSLKGQRRSLDHAQKTLDSGETGKGASKCSCLVMVIDEIELLLSENGKTSDKPSSGGEEVLKILGDWASAQNFRFALIGISNSIGNQQAKRLQKFGLAYNTITFSTYRKEDLICIVEDRVGNKIIDPKAIEFAASKVAASSGDARKVLELAQSAVGKCLEELSPLQQNDTQMDKPIVSLKFMLKAVKETVSSKYADRIEGLPQMAQMILCVAVTLNQVGKVSDTMTLGTLKGYVFGAMESAMFDEDELTIDTFSSLVQQLFDAGLLLSGTQEPFDVSQHSFAHLYSTPIRVGVQLEDVESALEKTLGDETLYRGIMERARKAKV